MELNIALFILFLTLTHASILKDGVKEIDKLETRKNEIEELETRKKEIELGTRKKEIEELELRKKEIVDLINDGIDDVLNHLGRSNDTNATEVKNFMEELRNRVIKVNENKMDDTTNDTRRQLEALETSFGNKKTYSKQFDRKKKSKKYQQRREEMEKRIEAWMAERKREKENKKKKRIMEMNYEFCPDDGLKKRSIKYPCCRKCCKFSYLGCL